MNSLLTHRDGVGAVFWRSGVAAKVFVAVLALGLSACASMDRKTPEEAVRDRAQARWDALVKGDFKAAYGYLSPGSRAILPESEYVNSLRRDFWMSAKVEKVVCATEKSCSARASIEYEFQGRRTQSPLSETWIREGSDWWYVQRS